MTKNIEYLIEQYGIELCRTHPSLRGKPMRHKDDQQKPQPTCITFSATKGEIVLERGGATRVDLLVSYRSESASPQQNSLVSDAIDECFSTRYTASLDLPGVLGEFSTFWIEDQLKSSQRDDTKSFRKFSYTIPMIAKLLD